MTYARLENGSLAEYPLYPGDIILRFPNTSFPDPFEPPDGYVEVQDTVPPAVTPLQNVAEGEPMPVGNAWVRTWTVSDASPTEIQERTAAMALVVRRQRNQRLQESDWTQLPDSPVSAAPWVTYRQALRNLPQQQGFPWEFEWPTPPA